MKTNAICTFPLYSGIFLNKKSKYTLLGEDSGVLKPKHRHHYAHHITLKFNPGGDFGGIKWGASVDMNVVRHVYNEGGQAIEVVPTLLKYKTDKDNVVEISDRTEINTLLGNTSERKYNVTLSLNDIHQDNELSPSRLDEVMQLSDDALRAKGYTVEKVGGVQLTGFVAVYSNVRLERNSLEFLRKKKKPRRVGYDSIPSSRRRF